MSLSTPPSDASGMAFQFTVYDQVNPVNQDYMPYLTVGVPEDMWGLTASISGGHDKVTAALEAAATAMYDSLVASYPSPDYEVHGRFGYSQPSIPTNVDPWPAP